MEPTPNNQVHVRWHIHRWSKWGKPYDYPESRSASKYQQRSCAICDKIKERLI